MRYAVVCALAFGIAAGALAGACIRPHATCVKGECPVDQIDKLWFEIRDWRVQAHMDADPSQRSMMQIEKMDARTVHKNAMCSTEPSSDRCDDVCGLAEAICDNSEQICGLAREMPDDSWAHDRCTSAKASCREAKERCCSCDDPDGDDRDK